MTVRPELTPSSPRRRAVRLVAGIAAVALLVAGCQDTPEDGGVTANQNTIRLYGSDGNMIGSFGGSFKDEPGMLAGMKGTTPLNPLTDEFRQRLKAVDGALEDYNYAGETYDAVVIAALAAETAKATDGASVAKYIPSVTVSSGTNSVTCDTIKACMDAIRAGKDIAYRGPTIRRGGMTDKGDPSTASYGTLTFGRDNKIDQSKTEFVNSGDDKTQYKDTVPAPPRGGGAKPPPLKIGALLPKTGGLAIAGPPIFAGANLAIKEINEAGGGNGVLGSPVVWVDGDDGTDPAKAAKQMDDHINAGVQVVIGASASGISKAVIPKAVAAKVAMISPTATADELTGIDDKGFFFRTAPPDKLQAKALTDVIMRYGAQKVAIIARDDAYGKGLLDNVSGELKANGVKAENIKTLTYASKEQYKPDDFTKQVNDAVGFKPEAILVVGFEESSNVIKGIAAKGIRFRD
ncbi:ABC transporter substrate-binding protein [Virgisporangium aliadipatigenens]|uniref:ABC transporter substrate-binding protein n=1 Tax=Virgisporangium aliadipatigenens TaxID=741659 RepID=UPI001EF34A15|nr:ABC transporter substrate-binding protein [Virgisporangium aliadipatigenens]